MELVNILPDFKGGFGDKRIENRANIALGKLLMGRNSSIRGITQTEAEQRSIYRLLDNPSFSEQSIERKIVERCGALCKDRHVLCIQDTTEFNLSVSGKRLKKDSGTGDISKTGIEGFLLHSSMVVDATKGTALGFSYIKNWHRPAERLYKDERQYQKQAIEQKESYKWIEATMQSRQLLSEASSITIIADRESDIYELISVANNTGIDLVLRSRIDRVLSSGKMCTYLDSCPVMHSYDLLITGDIRKGIEKRVARMDLKWGTVSIKKPKNTNNEDLPSMITLQVVEAKEKRKKGIYWRLLTTHPVNNAADALRIIDWYKQRWYIEQVHRLLKKDGFKIENSQLGSGYGIRKLTLLAMLVALRIIQMMLAYEDDTEQDISAIFDNQEQACLDQLNEKLQGTTENQCNPHKQGTIKWGTWVVARLGGWKGYKSQRKPGPVTLQKGLVKFYTIYEGWNLARQLKDVYTP